MWRPVILAFDVRDYQRFDVILLRDSDFITIDPQLHTVITHIPGDNHINQ